jgi:succinate-semialdehyde dehydrogenase/glutarate-semialdehyde dehydrogenase
VLRFAAPARMAGNVGLRKHASMVPQSGLLIEELFRRPGFPESAFQTLLGLAGGGPDSSRSARDGGYAHRQRASGD